jgi:hypothetical protein
MTHRDDGEQAVSAFRALRICPLRRMARRNETRSFSNGLLFTRTESGSALLCPQKYRVKNGPSSKEERDRKKTPGESPAKKRSKNDPLG